MPTPSTDEFIKKIAALPENVRRAMSSVATGERIIEIGRKYDLMIDEIGALSREIGYVMLGEKRAHEFVKNVQAALKTDRETAFNIAQDVNHAIFFQIRQNLKDIHGISQSAPLLPDMPLDAARDLPAVAGLPQRPAGGASQTASAPYWNALKNNEGMSNATPASPRANTSGAAEATEKSEPAPPAAAENQLAAAELAPSTNSLKREVENLLDEAAAHSDAEQLPAILKTAALEKETGIAPFNLPTAETQTQPETVSVKIEPAENETAAVNANESQKLLAVDDVADEPEPPPKITPYSADPYREPIEE